MGKTYKKFPVDSYHRKPKGRKQAIINNCRDGAIPPDAWDDLNYDKHTQVPLSIAIRLLKDKNMNEEGIRKVLKNKFNLKNHEISRIMKILENYL